MATAILLFRLRGCVSFRLCCVAAAVLCVITHTAAVSFLRPHSMQYAIKYTVARAIVIVV